jgi:hypothetical protein
MIDWWSVFINSLWLVGLAGALAILSYSDWLVSEEGRGLSTTFRRLVHNSGLFFSLALVCVGIGLGADVWWERGLWLLVTFGFSLLALRAWSRRWKEQQGG